MAKVEIYSTQVCAYCARAKDLLKRKGVAFEEFFVDSNAELRLKMVERAKGRRSVPQIFINDQGIGGCDDLYALDHAGKLDELLK